MSRTNLLDDKRQRAMVHTGIHHDDLLAELRRVAETDSCIAKPAAQFLLDGTVPENFDDAGMGEPQWEYFLRVCRTKAAAAVDFDDNQLPSLEVMTRAARIGQWPEQLPREKEDPAYTNVEMRGDFHANAPLIWACANDPLNLVGGNFPEWKPTSTSEGMAVTIAMTYVLKHQLRVVPVGQELKFLLAWREWVGEHGRKDVLNSLADQLGIVGRIKDLGVETLHLLSGFLYSACYELGRRGIALSSDVQDFVLVGKFEDGVCSRISTSSGTDDAQRFATETDPVVRYALASAHMGDEKTHVNPEDPFGERVSPFQLLAGMTRGWYNPSPGRDAFERHLAA